MFCISAADLQPICSRCIKLQNFGILKVYYILFFFSLFLFPFSYTSITFITIPISIFGENFRHTASIKIRITIKNI